MSATPLAGKVAIITGSSRSIGAAIAERLAADGANVIVNYVNGAAAAEEVAKRINSKGVGRAEIVQADVSSVESTKALVEKTLQLFNRLDILVLNAGIMDRKVLSDVTEEHFDKHFDVNVKGPLFLTQAAAPHIQTGGRVIFFSTSLTISTTISPDYLVYAATKGAVEQLTRVLSKDLGQRQITVNTVSPGPTATPLFKEGMDEQRAQFVANLSPMKRLGEPEDISSTVAFLARDDSQWVSGQNIRVNGAFAV
jgi:3-oxoacyl-[acyl-carrier protein] reductase